MFNGEVKGLRMGKKTVYLHALPDGTVAKRQSARAYTHVVVGCDNLARQREQAQSEGSRAHHRKEWAFYKLMATTPVGEPWNDGTLNGKHYCIVKQSDHDQCKPIIEQYPTAEVYEAARVAEALRRIPEGDAGALEVLQWSMSERNARSAIAHWSHWYVDVRVEPVNNGERSEYKSSDYWMREAIRRKGTAEEYDCRLSYEAAVKREESERGA